MLRCGVGLVGGSLVGFCWLTGGFASQDLFQSGTATYIHTFKSRISAAFSCGSIPCTPNEDPINDKTSSFFGGM